MTTTTPLDLEPADLESLGSTHQDLHRRPELAFEEIETARLIAAQLRDIEGVEEVREGVGKTGVTGVIRGAGPGRTLLLRADIDALPIHETEGRPHGSQVAGKMHACGHDGHTAILLAVARLLARNRDNFSGTAFLVFQPAEEIGAGARAMIEDGVMDLAGSPIDATLGLHLVSGLPVGTVCVRPGVNTASVDTLHLEIIGRGGHGAKPDQTVDPIPVAAEVILALQRIVSREVSPGDPVVVSICHIQAGTTHNVIPNSAYLEGTIRSFGAETRAAVIRSIERIVSGVVAASGAQHRLEIDFGTPSVVNDEEMCALVRDVAVEIVGEENLRCPARQPVGDDVALFLDRAPGCYFNVGAGNPDRGITAPHHHPDFDIDEECLGIAATIFARSALRYLSS